MNTIIIQDTTIRRCAENLVRETLLSAEAISGMTLVSICEITEMIKSIRRKTN